MARVILADLKSADANGICVGHYFALASNYDQVFSPHCDFKISGGPLYEKQFKKESLIVLPHSFVEGDNKLKNFFRMLFNAKKLFSSIDKDDVVIIQDSQPAMILFVLLLTYFGKANLFQIHYSEGPMRRWYFRAMMKFARRNIKGVLCPNENVGKAYAVPYICVPDYIYVEQKSFSKKQYAEKKIDFMSIGRIVNDKGILETAKAFVNSPHSLLIAGKPDENFDVKQLVMTAEKNKKISVFLDYLSESDFKRYIEESRYCILNYQGSYVERSSGVVLDTLFKGVPIVGRRCRALQFIEDYGMGFLYDDINDFDFSKILDPIIWQKCVDAIDVYKKQFEEYNKSLLNFVGVKN